MSAPAIVPLRSRGWRERENWCLTVLEEKIEHKRNDILQEFILKESNSNVFKK